MTHDELLTKIEASDDNLNLLKEPKIMKMDWRALGYWPVYRGSKLVWEKEQNEQMD